AIHTSFPTRRSSDLQLFVDEAPGVSGVETQFLRQPGRDGIELQTAVPGRVNATQLSGRHRGHEALCESGRGAEIDEASEQHTGRSEEHTSELQSLRH